VVSHHAASASGHARCSTLRSHLDCRARLLYEGRPVSAARTPHRPDNKLVAGVHDTYIDFLVWEYDGDLVLHIDNHMLLAVDCFFRNFLELLKKWLPAPSLRFVRIDVNGDQIPFHAQEHFTLVRPPLRAERQGCQPQAIKVLALRWPALVDGASAATRGAMRASGSNGFVKHVYLEELAAQRAITATSSDHQLNRVGCIV